MTSIIRIKPEDNLFRVSNDIGNDILVKSIAKRKTYKGYLLSFELISGIFVIMQSCNPNSVDIQVQDPVNTTELTVSHRDFISWLRKLSSVSEFSEIQSEDK